MSVAQRENCDVRGVLFTHPVGCSRLLSAVNDLTTTIFLKKILSKCHSEQLIQKVALFFDAAHSTSSEGIDFDEFMSSTSGHSNATMMYWMKKTTNAISDTARKESVQVALLQTHGEDGASLLLLR